MNNNKQAVLLLGDDRIFHGDAFGSIGETTGEICFNTGMTGYQEILTDPSYCRQIVTMTAPHIGNCGVNPDDIESDSIQVAGFVIKEETNIPSNWRSTQSIVTPYVVELTGEGAVRAVGPADGRYEPTDAQIAYHLAEFVKNTRSISIDPVVVRQNWLKAYAYATDRAAATLNDYARANDPFRRVGRQQIAVEVSSVIRASPNSFRVAWTERHYENGQLSTTERWTAILTIVIQPPRDAERLRANPFGIYVNAINWSREMGQ